LTVEAVDYLVGSQATLLGCSIEPRDHRIRRLLVPQQQLPPGLRDGVAAEHAADAPPIRRRLGANATGPRLAEARLGPVVKRLR
jgi:hypothetical protein